jgi:hypothetical protein
VPEARDQRCDLLHPEVEIWRPDGSDAARLRALEDENRRLKKLLAESMLEVSALKDLLGKN